MNKEQKQKKNRVHRRKVTSSKRENGMPLQYISTKEKWKENERKIMEEGNGGIGPWIVCFERAC